MAKTGRKGIVKVGIDPQDELKDLATDGEGAGDSYEGIADPSRPDPGPKMRWQVQAEEAEARAKAARAEAQAAQVAKNKAAIAFVKAAEGQKPLETKYTRDREVVEQLKADAPFEQALILPPVHADAPPKPDGPCCAGCRFAGAEEKPNRQVVIHCRRHPPIAVITDLKRDIRGTIISSETFSFFPILQPAAWCGDYEEGEPDIIFPGFAVRAQ